MQVTECKKVDVLFNGGRLKPCFYISPEISDIAIRNVYPNCHISNEVLTVFKTLDEVKENSNLALRKSAWSKLSIKEREALGMIEEPK